MNHTIFIAILLSATVAGALFADEPRLRRVVEKVSMDFSEHLDGPAKWVVGGKITVSLKMDGDSTVFLKGGDEEVFRLQAPEYLDEAILSEDGDCLVLVAMRSRGIGSDFETLILVQHVGPTLRVARVLESDQELFGGRRWWLSELGAISDDGKVLLAKFGVSYPDKDGGSRIVYKWYTIDVPTGKILSEGLTIANSNSQPEK